MNMSTAFFLMAVGISLCFKHQTAAVKGCITIKIDDNGKECICSQLTTKFTKIPKDLPDFVKKLEVKNQNIHSLTTDQLKKLTSLTDLNLDTNKLSSIDPDAFANIPELKILSLRNNLLILGGNSFPTASLLQLKNLRHLNLENNPLGFVPDFFFQPLKALQKLTLSRAPNGFYIESNGLTGLLGLEMLDISSSYLTTLDRNIESSLKYMQLHELYIFGNPWKCDCNMKWLKRWYLKFKDVKVSKQFTRTNGERGIAQPQCSTPNHYKGRNLFEISSNYDFIKLSEMNCPPRIFTQNKQLQIDRGKNLTLSCEFEADPGGDVKWSKNGMIVQKHWPRIKWGKTQGVRFTSYLTITSIEAVDNGSWRCILITDIDGANATFTVRVRQSYPIPIDLSIILKYIGIGAVTLILLLVIIGIAIYCIYGFKIKPSAKQTKPSIDRNIRSSHTDNDTRDRIQDLSRFRPILVDALINKTKVCNEGNNFSNHDDGQKCLLLPTSPTMLVPITSNTQFPCPLHGNVSFMNNSSFQDSGKHQSVVDYSDNIGLIQPNTLPRQNHKNKVRSAPIYVQTITPQDPNNIAACPLHGHILASLQTSGDDETDNLNAIYSTFFSPRRSQPLVNPQSPRNDHDRAQHHMSSSVDETTILMPINDNSNNLSFFSGPPADPGQHFPGRPSRTSSNHLLKKAHDDEGYSTSV